MPLSLPFSQVNIETDSSHQVFLMFILPKKKNEEDKYLYFTNKTYFCDFTVIFASKEVIKGSLES